MSTQLNNKYRINIIAEELSKGLYEKKEVIALTFLCSIAGKSIFLFGLPGTAKSLIVRRVASAFENSIYFGQLMNRFTTPEDVFGPVSLSKLKEDKFERKVEGYLPKADFVFLDEIWKSSPAILNTLLTIINEKVYRNGSQENRVPLKALVAASNETPPKGQGLEAMYDRFIMRLLVKPVEDVDNFNNLIVAEDIKFDANIDSKISTEELEDFKILINEIQVPDNILNIINYIKNEIEQYNKNNENKEPIYISDRRWKNIVYILKTAAFLSDREEILPVDCFLISHCIWELQEDIDKVKDTVIKAIENFSQINRDKFEDINNKVKDLHKDIDTDCINQEDIYKTENINDTKCCKIKIDYYTDAYQQTLHSKDLYIPRDKINTDDNFHPMLDGGQEFKSFICSFGGNTVLKVKVYNSTYLLADNGKKVKEVEKSLEIESKKGAFKTITSRIKETYKKACDELIEEIDNQIKISYEDLEKQKNKIDSIFVNENYRNIILKSYEDYIVDFKTKRAEVEQEKIKIEKCQTD